MHFEIEVHLPHSPERVMGAIADLDSWDRWMPNLVRVEKLTDGPFDLGTRWREVRKMFGREGSEVFRVTEYEPPGRLGLLVDGTEGTTGRGEYRFLYLLEPVPGGGSRVTLHTEIDMPGIGPKLFAPLMKRMMKKGVEKDLLALRDHLGPRE